MHRSDGHIFIGPDASGRSFALRRLAQAYTGLVVDLSPRPGERGRPLATLVRALELEEADVDAIGRALDARRGPRTLFVLDDAHALDDASLGLVAELVNRGGTVAISRRPRICSAPLAHLDDAVAHSGRVTFLGPVGPDELGAALGIARPGEAWRRSGGLLGIAALLDGLEPSPELSARVQRRLSGLGPSAADLALAMSLSPDADDSLLAAVLGVDESTVRDAHGELEECGFVVDEIGIVPVIGDVVRRTAGMASTRAMEGRFAVSLSARPRGDPVRVARHWLAAGRRGDAAADAFTAAGRALLDADPSGADLWFERAIEAGAEPSESWLDRATVAVALGADVPESTVHLATEGERERFNVVRAARLAEQSRWPDVLTALAVAGRAGVALRPPALLRSGRFDELLSLASTSATADEPDALVLACAAAITGVDPAGAFLRATRDDRQRALGAVVVEEADILGALVASAYDADETWQLFLPEPADHLELVANRRRRLLRAFLELRRGRYDEALSAIAGSDRRPNSDREAMLLAALQAGLSRRAVRPGLQRAAWLSVAEMLLGSVDLISAELFEELLVAAARHGDGVRVDEVVARLGSLARSSGSSVWVAQVAWIEVQIAVVGELPERVAAARQVLAGTLDGKGGRREAYAAAAASWEAVLRRRVVDIDGVVEASAGLEKVGLGYEAGQLLGQAALDLPVDDSRTARLLKLAQAATRSPNSGLRTGEVRAPIAPVVPGTGGSTIGLPGAEPLLSAREVQVAELKFIGLRNQDIADRLFIGVKTVETHITRLNAKLGVNTKAEFIEQFGSLRQHLHGPAP